MDDFADKRGRRLQGVSLEEQRIGVMYWNLMKGWFADRWDKLFPRGMRRSSALPFLVIAAFVALPSLGYYLHRRGRFSTLKRQIKGEQQGPAVPIARPGGIEPLVLTRTLTLGSNMPEFRSVTLLPGLGMDVLQLTASLPERGEMQLLVAPTAEDLVSGTAPERTGVNDSHGALEAPWGGLLIGMPTPVGTTIRTIWRGNAIEVPSDGVDHHSSSGGLLAMLSTDTAGMTTQPQGEVALAAFHASDFNQHWLSKTDVSVNVTLGPRTLDLTVTAKNVGDQPEPMGVGWHPRFAVPSGDRDGVELRLPMGEQMELADAAQGVPSGRFGVPAAAVQRLQGHSARLGREDLDVTLVNLKPALLDSGTAAEMRDPSSHFGLRMSADSASIEALRVSSPAGQKYVSLGTQTNFDDPFGREWSGGSGPGIAIVQPGQSLQWKVRVEIFAIAPP